MDFNIEVRRKQLENLDQFISSSKDRVDSILDYLGWTKEKINETHKEMANCVFDQHHRVPASKAGIHMQECSFRKEGYEKDEKMLSEPNPTSKGTILIDDTTKIQVLSQALLKNPAMKTGWRTSEPTPRTSDRLTSVYTSDERTALYDYAVASTSGPPQVPEFNITESKKEEKQNLTADQLQALERDAKRRRIKYKAKSVHISRKNTTEVMREIINGQMEAYEDWLKHELNLETSSTTSLNITSPVSSSRHSFDDESRKNGSKYRSRSKDSDRSKYSERFKYERDRSYGKDRSKYRHRSRSKSSSIRHEKERKHDNYSSRSKYDDYKRDRRERYKRKSTERSYEDRRHSKHKRHASVKAER